MCIVKFELGAQIELRNVVRLCDMKMSLDRCIDNYCLLGWYSYAVCMTDNWLQEDIL